MKINKKSRIITLLGMQIALASSALAQGSSGVGGGGFTESEMKGFMSVLVNYFETKDYSSLFPEVDNWEKKSNQRFSKFISNIEPKIVHHPVYFPAGVERDCVSQVETQSDGSVTRRWFECNAERVPESKLENQPKLYMLLAHEAFIHAGIERPGDANVPSTYEVSSRFLNRQNLTLETIQRYVPGSQSSAKSLIPRLSKEELLHAWSSPYRYEVTINAPFGPTICTAITEEKLLLTNTKNPETGMLEHQLQERVISTNCSESLFRQNALSFSHYASFLTKKDEKMVTEHVSIRYLMERADSFRICNAPLEAIKISTSLTSNFLGCRYYIEAGTQMGAVTRSRKSGRLLLGEEKTKMLVSYATVLTKRLMSPIQVDRIQSEN